MTEMVTHPKVSVLIPVYNVEKYVKRCIDSVLAQTMQDGVEVIIVNDCTPDRSMEIIFEALRTYNANAAEKKMMVRVVSHDTNRGSAAARNTAISYATGDYIIYVDSDDWIEPDMLEKMYTKAVGTDADITICDYNIRLHHRKVRIIEKYTDRETYFKEVVKCWHSSLWNKMIKSSLYIDNNVHFIEGLDCGEDFTVLLPLFYYAHKIAYVPEALYNYSHLNVNSITKAKIVSEKVKRNNIEKVEFARKFLQEHRLSGYETEWAYWALSVKAQLISHSSSEEERKNIQNLFPEATAYIPVFMKETSCWNRMLLKEHVTLYRILYRMKELARIILKRN